MVDMTAAWEPCGIAELRAPRSDTSRVSPDAALSPEPSARVNPPVQDAEREMRNLPVAERDDTALSAIRLLGEHVARGMDILLEHGPAYAFLDDVYVTSHRQIENALPHLRAAGVEVRLNDTLAGVRLTPDGQRQLAARDGWYNPDQPGGAAPDRSRAS